jgi:hypothetical protein
LVAGLYFLMCATGLLPIVLSGTLVNPVQLILPIAWGVLGFMLLKGSRIAQVLLAIASGLGVVVTLVLIGLVITADNPDGLGSLGLVLPALVLLSGLVSAASFYLLVFSKPLKAELQRRAAPAKQREDEERRKFYQGLGEKIEP